MIRTKYRHVAVDMQLLIETDEARFEQGAQIVMQAMNWKNLGLIVASSRQCDDGAIINTTMWLPGMTAVDVHHIRAAYEGFKDPQWPALPRNTDH